MNPHPVAQIFPPLEGDAFRELVDDIRQNGLLEPIVVLDGLIVDGRTRFRACEAAGVEPRFEEYRETLDPIEYVRCKNLHRRHLTASQRAAAAALADNLLRSEREQAARRRAQAKGMRRGEKAASVPDSGLEQSRGDSRDKVGEVFGVSGRQVDRARRLRERDPARFEAVKNGDKSIAAALRENLREELASRFPVEERARVLALLGGSELSDSTARRMASSLQERPAEERRRIYSLHASERPIDVRLAGTEAMGLPPQPDPVLVSLVHSAKQLKSYARTEFHGRSRVQLFQAAELISSVVRAQEERIAKLREPVFAGSAGPKANPKNLLSVLDVSRLPVYVGIAEVMTPC